MARGEGLSPFFVDLPQVCLAGSATLNFGHGKDNKQGEDDLGI